MRGKRKKSIFEFLHQIEINLNPTINKKIDRTPFKIIYGFIPIDPLKREVKICVESIKKKIRTKVQQPLEERNKFRDRKQRFNEGEWVLILNKKRSKTDMYWADLFRIVNIRNCSEQTEIYLGWCSRLFNIKFLKLF